MTQYAKTLLMDPDAVLDVLWDWTSWLASGETISSYVIAATDITVDSDSETAGVVTVWLSGGTAGTAAEVACEITTDAGRTDERTIRITIGER